MKTFLFACFVGVMGLAVGLVVFGRIDGQKIPFERTTLEKVDTFEEAWAVATTQPVAVYACGAGGFLAGCLAGMGLWLIHRGAQKLVSDASAGVSRSEVVPARPAKKSAESAVEKLEADRPRICKLLGFLTLGIYKFYAVPQGKALVVMAMGKYRKCCEPGLGAILSFWGFYQHPYKDMPLIECKECAVPYENETVVTSDGVKCSLDVMICYRIADPGKALFEVDNCQNAVGHMVRAVLRSEYAKQPTQTLRASREQMAGTLRETLERGVAPWGVKVRMVEITNLDIPTEQPEQRLDRISSI
jgi:hypothetical protein